MNDKCKTDFFLFVFYMFVAFWFYFSHVITLFITVNFIG